MGRPPEPAAEITFRPSGATIVPELSKGLLEQICAVDFQVQALKLTQPSGLCVGKIPRVF